MDTIPFLPKSIAVGLQDNLVQYMNELKFLLLFFDKPLAIFSNDAFCFINEEIMADIKKGKKVRPNMFGDEEDVLCHLEILRDEDSQELLSYCQPHYQTITLTIEKEEQIKNGVHYQSAKKIVDFYRGEFDPNNYKDLPNDKVLQMELGYHMLIQNFIRLQDILDMCKTEGIPMVWGSMAEIDICNMYSKYLLENSNLLEQRSIRSSYRILKGQVLLQEILNMSILNITEVPAHKIYEFKRNNQDLLNNFLINYRNFLSKIQLNPKEMEKIVSGETQKLIEDIQSINNEVSLLKTKNKFNWLKRVSPKVLDEITDPRKMADWSMLFGLLANAQNLGAIPTVEDGQIVGIEFDDKLEKQALLYRNSNSYLWKAIEKFPPK